MFRPSRNRSLRILCTIALSFVMFGAVPARPAAAQTGVIAFLDACNGLLYGMRGDGSDRMLLPLPALPEPASEYRYSTPRILDITTSGPLTVVYFVNMYRPNSPVLGDFGLYAVQLNDVGGELVVDPASPVRLPLPSDIGIAGVDPNRAGMGSFSSTGDSDRPDRLALVVSSQTASVLLTVAIDREPLTSSIRGLADPIVVVPSLSALGADPSVPTTGGFTGTIDYAPDGRSIVASSNYDLWLLRLDAVNQLLESERLTANTDAMAEWNPAYSPDGTRVAYTAGLITNSGGVRDTDIYSLTLATGAVTRVTSQKNKGKAASSRDHAMWSADSAWIGFFAYMSSTPRRAPCSSLVNSELFIIRADGSNTASQITATNGTSVEFDPKWGW